MKVADVIGCLVEDHSLRAATERLGGFSSISVLRMPSDRISDSPLLLYACNQKSDVVGILHVSQGCDSEQVLSGYLKAKTVADRLEYPLSRHVLLPVWVGCVDGRSCSFTECKKATSSGLLWKYQKRKLQQPVLQWLYASAKKTMYRVEAQADVDVFLENLDFFQGNKDFSSAFMDAVEAARESLLDGRWLPHHQVDHNDLWKGNLTLDNAYADYDRFFVIDWAGSNIDGFGGHDFITFSRSFGVSIPVMSKWLSRYAELFGGSPEVVMYQYLTGMGRLGANLNNFPYDRYVQKVSYEFSLLSTLLETHRRG